MTETEIRQLAIIEFEKTGLDQGSKELMELWTGAFIKGRLSLLDNLSPKLEESIKLMQNILNNIGNTEKDVNKEHLKEAFMIGGGPKRPDETKSEYEMREYIEFEKFCDFISIGNMEKGVKKEHLKEFFAKGAEESANDPVGETTFEYKIRISIAFEKLFNDTFKQ